MGWLADHPTKRPQYYILFLDVPSRINDPNDLNGIGVPVSIWLNMPHRKPFITSITMGASGTNDCVAYIDKLEAFGNAYSPGKVVISASEGGYSNEQHFFEDRVGIDEPTHRYGLLARDAVLDVGIAPEMVTFFGDGQHITSATNVAGYLSWGTQRAQTQGRSQSCVLCDPCG